MIHAVTYGIEGDKDNEKMDQTYIQGLRLWGR